MKIIMPLVIKALSKALAKDPDFYMTWQANIAVQFQNEWMRESANGGLPCTKEHVHKISNKAAKSFLNLLIRQ